MKKSPPSAPADASARADTDRPYEPHAIEARIYEHWEKGGWFAPGGAGEPFCIMIPPPNVTGSLHMGHAFQDTLMDALTRFHRMRGHNTLWQAGTDHAGIATQMVVERQLLAEKKTRHDLGRDIFLDRIWQWKAQSGGRITQQLRRMGASLDWSRERFTMDEGLSRAVTEVFVRLYDEGLIYRGQRLVNWDPVLHTAVSDLEVISEEESGHLWHIRYPLVGGAGGNGYVVVATTRPETMLGDVAVAVHPEDERYRAFLDKQVMLPLTGRTIPVIADEYVEREFGSGCVKITPAHDFNDYEVGRRHNLPLINIMHPDARIHLPGSPYDGLDRYVARKRILADLEAQGLLERTQPHKLTVPRGDRTQAVIEPYLTDQWYVKVGPLAEEAIRAVEDGRIRFVPENWVKTYYEWMRNIQDWCISRQIWWGHRIPAWYDDHGRVYVARSEPEARTKYKLDAGIALKRDDDVLDTWFSSALWPFSTLGWPEKTPELKTFYPTSVLVTGFDIIFFWVARMIMMGLKFTGEVPFREVYIHGLVRDSHGQKMSKSKGNVLDPLDLIDGIGLDDLVNKRTTGLMQPEMAPKIEKATRKEFPNGIAAYGTDALRMTFASLATQGRDIKFDLGRIEGYRNFCNKLWNATRFVLMNTDGHDCQGSGASFGLAERWIASRMQEVAREVEAGMAAYRFDLAMQAAYGFVWDEFCSWYLELSKVTLTDARESGLRKRGTRHTLVSVLETLLRMLHPFMPFITEELWQRVATLAGRGGPTIMLAPWPGADDAHGDCASIEEMRWVMQVITAIRNVRGERDIAPSKTLPVLVQGDNARERDWLEANRREIETLARTASLDWVANDAAVPESALALVGNCKVLLPLGALIDRDAEMKRLAAEIDKMQKNLDRAEAKLANREFRSRAPANIIEQEEARVREFAAAIEKLREQRERVEKMP